MTDKKCPSCGLWNSENATLCDCGFNFSTGYNFYPKSKRNKQSKTQNIFERGGNRLILRFMIQGLIFGEVMLCGFVIFIIPYIQRIIIESQNFLSPYATFQNIVISLGIILIIVTSFTLFVRKRMTEINIRRYRKDSFFGLVWKWDKLTKINPYKNIYCTCPRCKSHLNYFEKYKDTNYIKTIFMCGKCGYESQPIDGDIDLIQTTIIKQVKNRIETNAWEEIVKNY